MLAKRTIPQHSTDGSACVNIAFDEGGGSQAVGERGPQSTDREAPPK